MESVVLPLLVGIFVGFVVGLLGGGGGVLTVPILVYLLGQSPQTAATSSLVIVGVTSLAALIPHARAGSVQWRAGFVFALLAVAGTFGGAILSVRVDGAVLMALFAVLLMAVAIMMLRKVRERASGQAQPGRARGRRALQTVTWALAVGVLTGFFGVGGGFAVVPALTLALGFRMHHAVATSLLVIVVNSGAGLVGRIGADISVDWALIAVFTTASVVTGQIGARLSARIQPRILTRIFGLLLAGVALATAVQAGLALAS